jgi:hypothetical protein
MCHKVATFYIKSTSVPSVNGQCKHKGKYKKTSYGLDMLCYVWDTLPVVKLA